MIWFKHALVAVLAVLMAGIVLAVLLIGFATLSLQKGPIELPRLQAIVEKQISSQFSEAKVKVGAVSLASSDSGVGNNVVLKEVSVLAENGREIIAIPELRTQFSLLDVAKGSISPEELLVSGLEVSLERSEDGRFDLFGIQSNASNANVFAFLESLESQQELKSLKVLEIEKTKVSFLDQMTKQSWDLDDSTLQLSRNGTNVSGRAVLKLKGNEGNLGTFANLILQADHVLGSDVASFAFQFEDAVPSEIADLFQAFDWLRNIDAKISGSVRADLDSQGRMGNMHGVLELSDGRLVQAPNSHPISFEKAKVYFDYDPQNDVFNLSEVNLQTSLGNLTANGFAEFERNFTGNVSSLAGQFRVKDIKVSRQDLFDSDILIPEAALTARVTFEPLKIEIGRLTVFDENTVFNVSGHSEVNENKWQNSYEIDVDNISAQRLKQLWPKPVVHKTRRWVHENIFSGQFQDFSGGIRMAEGKPIYAFNFKVQDAEFQFVKTLPHMKKATGFGYLTDKTLRLHLNQGTVETTQGGEIDVAGTSLFIPDTVSRPTPGEIELHAKGSIRAAFEILNAEKFKFLEKVGLKPSVASGNVSVKGDFRLPLSKETKTEEVKLDLVADLTNVKSTELVAGRTLHAQYMEAKVSDDGVQLTGNARLDEVPVKAVWEQSFKKGDQSSKIYADVTLTQANLNKLGINLPRGTVSGQTTGNLTVDLKRGTAPKFKLYSNLKGASLAISALGWTKGKGNTGELSISGSLGDVPTVDSFLLYSAGLKALGVLDLNKDGSLKRARFSELNIGKWLSAQATLTPKGPNRTDIVVHNGTADLRFLNSSSSSESSQGVTNISVNLGRVRITDTLSLTEFSSKLNTKKGLRGTFAGRVNGKSRVDGQLFPQKHGTAFELTSNNAGGVMASADLLTNARDGTLRVVLIPRAGEGNYDGTLDVQKTRIKDASAMAALLNGISLVGALQQLEGEGIHFSTVEGQFKLRKNGVKLEKISAVGPSIGMTLDGWYNAKSKSVDFEGVITPLYVVNGIFERLFGPLMGRRKGEGMFSFTYRMRGPASGPKVGVNPLSILTPGAFREIFRQTPPAPPTQ